MGKVARFGGATSADGVRAFPSSALRAGSPVAQSRKNLRTFPDGTLTQPNP